jgi:hypothetical protein
MMALKSQYSDLAKYRNAIASGQSRAYNFDYRMYYPTLPRYGTDFVQHAFAILMQSVSKEL